MPPEPVPVPVPVPAAIANGKESPLMGSSEFYHFRYAEDLLDHHRFSTSSLVEDFSASLDAAFHGPAKKPRRWRKAWSLWGLIHRRAAAPMRRTARSRSPGQSCGAAGTTAECNGATATRARGARSAAAGLAARGAAAWTPTTT